MLEEPISVTSGVNVASTKADTITILGLDTVSLLDSYSVNISSTRFNESEIILGNNIGLEVST